MIVIATAIDARQLEADGRECDAGAGVHGSRDHAIVFSSAPGAHIPFGGQGMDPAYRVAVK
jgi:hypothetical protein